MSKTLTVASEVQKVVFTEVLLGEIASGFWKNARPADHAESWVGVSVVVGTNLGVAGFEAPRKYNFVNPSFFPKLKDKLLAAARTVNPEITEKQLKKQLLSLNQIIDSRLTEIGGAVKKLPRGRKQSVDGTTAATTKKNTTSTVRRAPAQIIEQTETTADEVTA